MVPWKSIFYVQRLKESVLTGIGALPMHVHTHRNVMARELEVPACHSVQSQGIIAVDLTLRIL